MEFKEKLMTFTQAIANVWRSEENREKYATLELNDENITSDFTAALFSLNLLFNKITKQEVDIVGFTHILNDLAVQCLLDDIAKKAKSSDETKNKAEDVFEVKKKDIKSGATE